MTRLEVELVRILATDTLQAPSIPQVLWATGWDSETDRPPTLAEIQKSLDRLVEAGKIKQELRRGRRFYLGNTG